MKIEELYKNIKSNNVDDQLIIFKNQKDNDFIATEYINEIANQHRLIKEVIEDLSEVKPFVSVFDSLVEPTLKIYKVDKFDSNDTSLFTTKNLVISCNSISKETEKLFKDYIVVVPKLEDWQIKDFAYSQLEGISLENVNWLVDICNNNIDRVKNEVDRLKIFSKEERNAIIYKFRNDFIYEDLSNSTIFDFINAIVVKDKNRICQLYKELKNIDFSEIGMLVLLYNNFRNIINVQINNAPSPESCNLKPNQFWAIKHNINHYTKDQLFNIFNLLTEIDSKIKLGELPVDFLLDYLLVYILSY